jgi:hypothetical protein
MEGVRIAGRTLRKASVGIGSLAISEIEKSRRADEGAAV